MKRSWGRWALLGAMALGGSAMAQGGSTAKPQSPEQQHQKLDPKATQTAAMSQLLIANGMPAFLSQLRAINETEMSLGELSHQKASTPSVQQYGEHMVQDHRKANQQLLEFAKQRGMQLPLRVQPTNNVQTRLLSATDATKAKLSVLDGPLYDQQYLASQVAAHDEAIQLVTLGRQLYPDLAPLLDGLLPTLREHRDQAYQLLGQVQSPPQAQVGPRQPEPQQPAQPQPPHQARPPAGERR
ncbi:DUF4142 domain-containing protein [Archangium sp.]|uniref:DUF4142 domain-containing protein n=1 Tax=Archangium sp. TaxID=1872627 RepID=UPI002D725404|nr:DUF4142 domain-containing protein [Archangium sp.]HYO56112.1 DUF4142 domain-containing protein [Archangium sp.]